MVDVGGTAVFVADTGLGVLVFVLEELVVRVLVDTGVFDGVREGHGVLVGQAVLVAIAVEEAVVLVAAVVAVSVLVPVATALLVVVAVVTGACAATPSSSSLLSASSSPSPPFLTRARPLTVKRSPASGTTI